MARSMMILVAMLVVMAGACAQSTFDMDQEEGAGYSEYPEIWEEVGEDPGGGDLCLPDETIEEVTQKYPEPIKFTSSCARVGFDTPSFCQVDAKSILIEYWDDEDLLMATVERGFSYIVYKEYDDVERVVLERLWSGGQVEIESTWVYDKQDRLIEKRTKYLQEDDETCLRYEFLPEVESIPDQIDDGDCWVETTYLRADGQPAAWVAYGGGFKSRWLTYEYNDESQLSRKEFHWMGSLQWSADFFYDEGGRVSRLDSDTDGDGVVDQTEWHEYEKEGDLNVTKYLYSWPEYPDPVLTIVVWRDKQDRLVREEGYRPLEPDISGGYESQLELSSFGYYTAYPQWRYEQEFDGEGRFVRKSFFEGEDAVQDKSPTEERRWVYDGENLTQEVYERNVGQFGQSYLGFSDWEGERVWLYGLNDKLFFEYRVAPSGFIMDPVEYRYVCE